MHGFYGEKEEFSLALLTDLYQLTMAQGYWRLGMANRLSCFHLFFRKKPFHGNYAIAAGIESILKFIENFHYSDSDLSYLEELISRNGKPIFEKNFLKYLSTLKMECSLDAVEEGVVVFPYEPLAGVSRWHFHLDELMRPS